MMSPRRGFSYGGDLAPASRRPVSRAVSRSCRRVSIRRPAATQRHARGRKAAFAKASAFFLRRGSPQARARSLTPPVRVRVTLRRPWPSSVESRPLAAIILRLGAKASQPAPPPRRRKRPAMAPTSTRSVIRVTLAVWQGAPHAQGRLLVYSRQRSRWPLHGVSRRDFCGFRCCGGPCFLLLGAGLVLLPGDVLFRLLRVFFSSRPRREKRPLRSRRCAPLGSSQCLARPSRS